MRRVCVGVLCLLTACIHSPAILTPAPADISGVHVVVGGVYCTGGGYFTCGTVSGLYGTATNTTPRDMTSVFINFDILDSHGAKVADAIASTTGLRAGQSWRFQATLDNAYAVYFKEIRIGRVNAFF